MTTFSIPKLRLGVVMVGISTISRIGFFISALRKCAKSNDFQMKVAEIRSIIRIKTPSWETNISATSFFGYLSHKFCNLKAHLAKLVAII